jgi:hypothetical protein
LAYLWRLESDSTSAWFTTGPHGIFVSFANGREVHGKVITQATVTTSRRNDSRAKKCSPFSLKLELPIFSETSREKITSRLLKNFPMPANSSDIE